MIDSGVKREIEDEALDFVDAEFVTVKQSTVRAVEGGHVELHNVGALSIDGDRVEATQCASGIVNGAEVNLNQSMSIITAANNASLTSSFSSVVLSKEKAFVKKSAVGILGARDIKVDNVSSILMLANNVEGDVTTLLDWRSALALGAVIGGALGFISLFTRKG